MDCRGLPDSPAEAELTDIELQVVELVSAVGVPVPVAVAARALNALEPDVVDAADHLVAEGRLSVAAGSLVAVDAGNVSEVRRSHLAAKLADAFGSGAPHAVMGRLLALAGRPADAALAFGQAVNEAERTGELDQAANLAGQALAADNGLRVLPRHVVGHLHLVQARHLRSVGDTVRAMESLDAALPRLEGEEKVDGLGFAAAIADDAQRPQRAETTSALGTGEALRLDLPAKAGSLLTLQARELSRLGFAAEADRSLELGLELLSVHGDPGQQHRGRANRAWILLDRGDVGEAERSFDRLCRDAEDLDDQAEALTRRAYWGRSLLGAGRLREAMEIIADVLARSGDDHPATFISHLGVAEYAAAAGRLDLAVESARAADSMTSGRLAAWENVTAYLLARGLRHSGEVDASREALDRAYAACPEGIDGRRWRQRIRALAMDLDRDSGVWPQTEAEDLTDEMLQAGWHGAAVELMTLRADAEDDRDLGLMAAGLALRLGSPLAAMWAIEAAGAWDAPEATAVAASARRVGVDLPDGWGEAWSGLDPVRHASGLAVEDTSAAADELRARLDEAFVSAGLVGTEVASPAQRYDRGLVRRRAARATRRVATWLATGVAVAATAVVAAIVAVGARERPPQVITVPAETTTTTLALNQRPVEPEGRLSGGAAYRGGPGRPGVLGEAAVREVTGRYWVSRPGGELATPPVIYGTSVFVGSRTAPAMYLIDLTRGNVFRLDGDESVTTAAEVAQMPAVQNSGAGMTLSVFTTRSGRVEAYQTTSLGQGAAWERDLGSPGVGVPLIVGRHVIVATEDGRVHALDGNAGGEPLWAYPAPDEEPMGSPVGAPAYGEGMGEGVVYVADRSGSLHRIALETGEPVCSPLRAFSPAAAGPVVTDEAVYLPLESGQIQTVPADACAGEVPGRAEFYALPGTPIRRAPAVDDTTMYLIEQQRVVALKLDPSTYDPSNPETQFAWRPVDAGSVITTAPTVSGGVVYVGTQDGVVLAVDASSGEELWRFELDGAVVGAPAVVDGGVVAVTTESVWAIAGR